MGANTSSSSATFQNPLTSLNNLEGDAATIVQGSINFATGGLASSAKDELNKLDGTTASQQAQAQSQAEINQMTTSENNLVTQQQDQMNQQSSSAAAVTARNAARQSQLTAAANYTGYSGTILGSPLGGSSQPTNSGGKSLLGA